MNKRIWTPADEAELVRLYPLHDNRTISKMINRTESAVDNRAQRLGLRKPAGWVNSGTFQPGHITWNKGCKGLQIGGEATQFKPGQMPHNTLEVGEYRICMGYLQRKIGHAKGSNSKRWRAVHELVWIAANGPVPDGCVVVFKPGQKTNELTQITLDRVECITRRELMLRNTRHNLPKPIADLIALRCALVRKINKQQKEASHGQ